MAKIEYKSSNSHITIDKPDLDELRDAMKKMYQRHGGEHSLTESSSCIYDNLDDYFKSRLQELDARIFTKEYAKKNRIEKKVEKETERVHPDPTFLRDLFYTKADAAQMKSKQYNFDLCYFFAFGISRQQYTANKRAKNGTVTGASQLRVVVSSLSQYAPSVHSVETYMVTKVGRVVERDLRDVKSPNIGPLIAFHSDKGNSQTPALYLVGKDHFFNEDFVLDFVHLSRELKDAFVMNARIIFLEDLWQGEFNVNNSAGVLRITQHWLSHIEFMEQEAQKRKGKKILPKHKELAKKASADMRASKEKTKLIIQEIPPLIQFLLKETQCLPYSYFMNTISKEDVIKWLNTKGAA